MIFFIFSLHRFHYLLFCFCHGTISEKRKSATFWGNLLREKLLVWVFGEKRTFDNITRFCLLRSWGWGPWKLEFVERSWNCWALGPSQQFHWAIHLPLKPPCKLWDFLPFASLIKDSTIKTRKGHSGTILLCSLDATVHISKSIFSKNVILKKVKCFQPEASFQNWPFLACLRPWYDIFVGRIGRG